MKTSNLARILLVAVAAGAAGCTVEKVGTVDLTGVCTWPDDATACAFSDGCDAYNLLRYQAYVNVTDGVDTFWNELLVPLELRNQVFDNADDTTGTNSNDAFVESWELSFSSPDLGGGLGSTTYPAVVTRVPAGGNTAVSVATVVPYTFMETISTAMTNAGVSGAMVRVDVRAKGHYGSGGSGRAYESGTMQVWVELFNATWSGYGCPVAGEVVVAVCPPNALGQTATVACEAP
ncbi:MAG: hypothetical protein QM767_10730 [Anaeromyxobacter sp.]